MTTTITERDKKLLVFLAIFLILSIGIIWVIQPALDDIADIKEQTADAELLQQQNQQKVDGLVNMISGEQAMEGAVSNLQDSLYPVMNTADIGDVLNGLADSSNAELTAMDIAIPDAGSYMTVRTYYGNSEIEGTTCYGVYDVTAAVTLAGTEEELRAFLENAGAESGKILVRQYTWGGSGDERQLSVTLSLFMAESLTEYQETQSSVSDAAETDAAETLTLQ